MKHLFCFLTLFVATNLCSMQRIIMQHLKARSYCQNEGQSVTNHARKQELQRRLEKNWNSLKKNCKQADSWKVIMHVCADFGCTNSCTTHGADCCRKIYEMHERAARKNALALQATKKEMDQLDALKLPNQK